MNYEIDSVIYLIEQNRRGISYDSSGEYTNYTGVTISGDYYDFEALYDSLHAIVGDEWEWENYEGARLRVLGVCYDIRHAFGAS